MKKILFVLSLLVITIGAFCIDVDRPPDKLVQVEYEMPQDGVLEMEYEFQMLYVSDYIIQERNSTLEITAEKRKDVAVDFKSLAMYLKKSGTERTRDTNQECNQRNEQAINRHKTQTVRIRSPTV